jgi:hypothetical protein
VGVFLGQQEVIVDPARNSVSPRSNPLHRKLFFRTLRIRVHFVPHVSECARVRMHSKLCWTPEPSPVGSKTCVAAIESTGGLIEEGRDTAAGGLTACVGRESKEGGEASLCARR